MILPTKHIRPERALIGVGAEVLTVLKGPSTVSNLWDAVRRERGRYAAKSPIAYDWFILALDFLFIIGAIELDRGLIRRA